MSTIKDVLVGAGCMVVIGLGLGACQKEAPAQKEEAQGLEKQAQKPSAAAEDSADAALVERGEYLVKHVVGCGDCHTPRGADGQVLAGKFLGGTKGAPNLTPAEGGLGGWSAADIKKATFQGVMPDGHMLSPNMPYWMYQAMDDADQDAVVSFLQSIPPVSAPAHDDDHDHDHDHDHDDHPPVARAEPLTVDMMPETTLDPRSQHYAAAQRGKQLAIFAGCAGCHTEAAEAPMPLNQDKLLAGGKDFGGMLPSPPFPEAIIATNLTPDANGLGGWTPAQIVRALKEGVDPDGRGVCPPMPSGPHGTYGQMHDEDALALAHYLTTIPAVDNGELPNCVMPEQSGE